MDLSTFKQAKVKFLAGQLKWHEVRGYAQYLWRHNFPLLTRPHIRQVIAWRKERIRPECKKWGECQACGCSIPGLEYKDEMCKGGCWPDMPSRKMWKTMNKQDWEEPFKNIGDTKGGQTTEVVFKYIGPHKPYRTAAGSVSVSSGCGCSVPVWDEEEAHLKVLFTPKPLPPDSPEPSKPTTKSVHILMDEGGTTPQRHTLTFTANIV